MRSSGGRGGGRSLLFHSPAPLVVGPAPLVGVVDLPAMPRRPPIRLFFPAEETAASMAMPGPAKYFVDNRVAYVLQGFVHIILARHTTKLYRFFLRPLMWLLSLAFPARFLKIPGTALLRSESDLKAVKYAPPSSLALQTEKKSNEADAQSLVVFSHGLTGTGEENSVFCAALAKRGHVVAAVHHTDGSSARVPLADGTCRFYEHLPTGEDYSPKHRLEQVHHRAREFLHCCSWLMGDEGIAEDGHHPILDQIRPHLDEQKLIAAGFSYGSTTVSLAATLQPDKFQCAVLLDPWLHIDYTSKGVEFDLPPEAFGAGWPAWPPSLEADASITDDETKGLDVPSLLLYSSQFEGYTKLFNAGQRLADRINARSKKKRAESEVHVIPGTAHQNFCDVIFWLPRRLSRKMFGLGESDAYESYEAILDRTVRFLGSASEEAVDS